MALRFFRRKKDRRASIKTKLILSLGSLAIILIASGAIILIEYRRMSDYLSNTISSSIWSADVTQDMSDITRDYNYKMLDVVVQDNLLLMPDIDLEEKFVAQADSLQTMIESPDIKLLVSNTEASFKKFAAVAQEFKTIFKIDSIDNATWYFEDLQPRYHDFRKDMAALNNAIGETLHENTESFDEGFYRSIIPGIVAMCAGIMLILLLLYFTIVNYVNPIKRMSDGIDAYKSGSRTYSNKFDGDDQLQNINTGLTELIEENLEMKRRLRKIREERNQSTGN